MLTFLIIGLWISSALGSPIETQKHTPLIYYTPPASQSVPDLYPFIQYPNESPAFGKALQSISSQNEILFYPNIPQQLQHQQPFIVNAPPGNVPVVPFRAQPNGNAPTIPFTAPPSGLVDAIYAWFAENNIPFPDDPNKNEATPGKIKDQEKPDNTEKTAGEAEILAEADRNPTLHYPKKPVSPKFSPGQRFYILNGQPQFVSNYQPFVPRFQPVASQQFLNKNSIPMEPQNYLFLQPENQKQNINIKKQTQQQHSPNVVLIQDQMQREIKPVKYHASEFKPQNYVLLRENQPREIPSSQIQVQPLLPNYSRQQLLIGRLLPQSQDIKQQQVQTPIHQTHYVPVEVVPPQTPQFQTAQLYQQQDLPQYHSNLPQQEEINQQPELAFIHIPVDRNVQPPQYIPTKPQPIPTKLPSSQGKQILYISPESQHVLLQRAENKQDVNNRQTAINSEDLAPGIAALEFARYITSRQQNLYSDTVVIDAKAEDEKKEGQEEDSEEIHADDSQEPSIAQAQPGGIALAGPGGVAATAPRGTALVGDKGLAVASPKATAVAGPNPNKGEKEKNV